MKELHFLVDGQKIAATIQYPQNIKEKNPAVLFVHGWMASQKRNILYAQELTKLGYICMTIDLRSHGESEGERGVLSREDYMRDMVAAYDLLATQKGVDAKRIGLVGSSFGSYLGAILTSQRDIRWLALRVPANYPDEGFDQPQVKFANKKTTEWRKEKLTADATLSLRSMHAFKNDVLIVESELDELCPHQTMENYMNALPNKDRLTHTVIKGADHSMKSEKFRKEFTKIIIDWFGQRGDD